MGKYKKTLVADIKKRQADEKKQTDLKEKYHVDPAQDVLIVEKDNMMKFTVRTVTSLVRIFCSICLFILAVVGILALVYPTPRIAVYGVLQDIFHQFHILLPFSF